MRARTFLGLVAAAALAACGAPTAPDAAPSAAVPAFDAETPPDTTGGHGSGYLGSGNNTTPPGGG